MVQDWLLKMTLHLIDLAGARRFTTQAVTDGLAAWLMIKT